MFKSNLSSFINCCLRVTVVNHFVPSSSCVVAASLKCTDENKLQIQHLPPSGQNCTTQAWTVSSTVFGNTILALWVFERSSPSGISLWLSAIITEDERTRVSLIRPDLTAKYQTLKTRTICCLGDTENIIGDKYYPLFYGAIFSTWIWKKKNPIAISFWWRKIKFYLWKCLFVPACWFLKRADFLLYKG